MTNEIATEPQTSPYPIGYCERGSLLNLQLSDWKHFAKLDRERAQRSDAKRIQAENRQNMHRECCPRCGGGFP